MYLFIYLTKIIILKIIIFIIIIILIIIRTTTKKSLYPKYSDIVSIVFIYLFMSLVYPASRLPVQ